MMKKFFLPIILLAALIGAAYTSAYTTETQAAIPSLIYESDSARVDTLFEEDPYFILMGEADSAIVHQRWSEAVLRLSDVLAVRPVDPSNALILYNMGICHGHLGNDSLALDCFDRSLELAPNMLVTLLARGRQLLAMNRDYEAFDTFTHAIEVDSISTEARFYHGMMALFGGKSALAEQDFMVLKRIAPYSADTATALGTLYSLTGREREALPYLRQLVEEDPQPETFASLAGCYLALEQLSDASTIIADGLGRYPDDPELYYYRAWLRRDQYLLDEAHADAARAIRLGASPTRVNALFAR